MEKCVFFCLFFSDNGLIILSVPLTGYIYQLSKTNFYYNTFHTINSFISNDYDKELTLIILFLRGAGIITIMVNNNCSQSPHLPFQEHFVFFVVCSPIWQPFATCGYLDVK